MKGEGSGVRGGKGQTEVDESLCLSRVRRAVLLTHTLSFLFS